MFLRISDYLALRLRSAPLKLVVEWDDAFLLLALCDSILPRYRTSSSTPAELPFASTNGTDFSNLKLSILLHLYFVYTIKVFRIYIRCIDKSQFLEYLQLTTLILTVTLSTYRTFKSDLYDQFTQFCFLGCFLGHINTILKNCRSNIRSNYWYSLLYCIIYTPHCTMKIRKRRITEYLTVVRSANWNKTLFS